MPKPMIDVDKCKGCGLCASVCPAQVIELAQERRAVVKRAELCTGCRACEALCPERAIVIVESS
ncbi:MAG: 4Fe-4S ferredoxin [Thermoprotei archaeon]|nr:MAG: 4Fe-4S ferredoxin [Thermoprotei archaeon]RLF23952.1 MAG: 4Fe-4S ferredoxin [Thermoprotei archaeon]